MFETSIVAMDVANSQAVSVSTTSAQSSAISGTHVTIFATAACFMLAGANPTALSNGTCQYVPANTLLRVQIKSGAKLAFIVSTGAATVYITPGA